MYLTPTRLLKIKSLDDKILYYPLNILIHKCTTISDLYEDTTETNFVLSLRYTQSEISFFLSFIEFETLNNIKNYDTLNEFEDYLITIFSISNYMGYNNHTSIYTYNLIDNTMKYIINMDDRLSIYRHYKNNFGESNEKITELFKMYMIKYMDKNMIRMYYYGII